MTGGELGHFSLLERIGEGGMGRVYKARDKRLDRLVAIKVLNESLGADADRRARFVQEAKAASGLNHPNIVTIHEIGEQDGQTYIVMELVDGKPLSELIPRKGMQLTEALRIAAQVADALAASHAAGIVHRDVKPANIMVDSHGRVRVLDFGLAKLSTPVAARAVDDSTCTIAIEPPVTEEGFIVGSVPYMSPEQAEGKPVDARSDIFSFGAVLYEMVTGQRAFRGGSQAYTLAAVVTQDPQPPSEISSTTPLEVERLIVRCLRKDVSRRSQSIADVKLALEELRDDSESGKLARPIIAVANIGARHWVWPAVAIASVLMAAAAFYLTTRVTQPQGPDLVRISPDDGHSYFAPAISPDGGFVAYVSGRSGKDELWLQQVGGGDPIQLTHSEARVDSPAFFPDGKRILYVATSVDGKQSALEAISTLGGDPRVLARGGRMMNEDPLISPDGRQIAYFEFNPDGRRLMTISSEGGQPRELPAWAHMPGTLVSGRAAWTSDSRYLLCLVTAKSGATNVEEMEWFAFPVDGGVPLSTGAGEALRAAGITQAAPYLMSGDRVIFAAGSGPRWNAWDIRLTPGSWRVRGTPRQLTFGTLIEAPNSLTATGVMALQVGNVSTDLYLIPLSPVTGQPSGPARRLTRDGRDKKLWPYLAGAPGSAYFSVRDRMRASVYAVDLESAKQTLVTAQLSLGAHLAISTDGRQVAYSIQEGDSYSIRVGDTGSAWTEARVLCKACGLVEAFSPGGRFVFYRPQAKVQDGIQRKSVVRLLDVASGKDRPWLEHPIDSVFVDSTLDRDPGWLIVTLSPPGSPSSQQSYLVRWKEEPVPQSEWIKIPWPGGTRTANWRVSQSGNFFYLFEGSKLTAVRFDSQKGSFGEPVEVEYAPGSAVTLDAGDDWTVRGPGLVISREETIMSVWTMKLPH